MKNRDKRSGSESVRGRGTWQMENDGKCLSLRVNCVCVCVCGDFLELAADHAKSSCNEERKGAQRRGVWRRRDCVGVEGRGVCTAYSR